MRVIFLGSKSATGAPTDVAFETPFDHFVDERVGVFQAEFAGTATVNLEGRLTGSANWTTITTITSTDSSKAKTVALMPLMRINITSWTSGLVSGWLGI